MKKYFHALPGNLEITKGKTIQATILGREDGSILVQLENGMFATIDFDNVFMKCGHNVWQKMIAAKSKFERTKVRITHITHDCKIKVVPWGRYDKYAKLAKELSDAIQNLDNLKKSIVGTYNSLKRYEEKYPDIEIRLTRVEQALTEASDKKAQKALLKEKESLMTSLQIMKEKENFIKEATKEVLDGEEMLKSFDLLSIND